MEAQCVNIFTLYDLNYCIYLRNTRGNVNVDLIIHHIQQDFNGVVSEQLCEKAHLLLVKVKCPYSESGGLRH